MRKKLQLGKRHTLSIRDLEDYLSTIDESVGNPDRLSTEDLAHLLRIPERMLS